MSSRICATPQKDKKKCFSECFFVIQGKVPQPLKCLEDHVNALRLRNNSLTRPFLNKSIAQN